MKGKRFEYAMDIGYFYAEIQHFHTGFQGTCQAGIQKYPGKTIFPSITFFYFG
jgi:hypothetical protein